LFATATTKIIETVQLRCTNKSLWIFSSALTANNTQHYAEPVFHMQHIFLAKDSWQEKEAEAISHFA
jgi:hypothetical protein